MGKKYKREELLERDEYKEAVEHLKVVYIIDTENVIGEAYENLSFLKKKDTLYFTYTRKSNNLDLKTIEKINNCKAKKVFEDTLLKEAAHNGLDFKMVARATDIIINKKDSYVVLVSKDKGFDSAVDYIRDVMGYEYIRREDTIRNPYINLDDLQLTTEDMHYYKRNY